MPETILEELTRALETESATEKLAPLPGDFYRRLALYTQNLRRQTSSGNSEITDRLFTNQTKLIVGMVRRLVSIRMKKASAGVASTLLPEEKYTFSSEAEFIRSLDEFIEAVTSGQTSYLEYAQHSEETKGSLVRILKPVTEIVGPDLRKHGPFRPNDMAFIPSANADILVANGEAVRVHTRKPSQE